MGKNKQGKAAAKERAARDAIMDMEPDPRLLGGLITVFRILGEAADHVEPDAIAAAARCSEEAIQRLTASWKAALSS